MCLAGAVFGLDPEALTLPVHDAFKNSLEVRTQRCSKQIVGDGPSGLLFLNDVAKRRSRLWFRFNSDNFAKLTHRGSPFSSVRLFHHSRVCEIIEQAFRFASDILRPFAVFSERLQN